ncbi:cyclic nucleotide-binding domain-containing protein [Pelosinus baikalensis]|uniref:Cyclic nucleotide-binding domain-containing protein n=1 Tax=Pelosinus baikalensis TaxID=2892015 RepID=A0ABS8I1J2_9FIRM|nr:cyclic nucleotide-binding domain-containing protein [Pelosinus baikalensis]MCC5468638.1 cyclic nucleotide-binding domain-containing protein [Pelosinus baikalensis]
MSENGIFTLKWLAVSVNVLCLLILLGVIKMNNTLPIPFYQKKALEEPIVIGIATTPEEKMEIYRLRYRIYAEEISYKLVSADHSNKLLYDELDEWGILLYVRVGTELIGTARMNVGRISDFPSELVQIFLMNKFHEFYKEEDKQNFSFISKGMISPDYRSSQALNMLMEKIYELYLNNQVQFGFVNCNFHLISLHEHYGSRRLGVNYVDPNLGLMASFVMLIDDIEHLRAVGSPLINIASKKRTLNNRVVDWFHSEFAETTSIINSQLISEDELWVILCNRLGNAPNKIIPILKGLSVTQAKKILHCCGVVVPCPAGSYIVSRGDVSNELNILLSGTIQSSGKNNTSPDKYLGAIGLVNRTKHTVNIIAATNVEILVLSFHYFQKFRRSCPEIAKKVLHNLSPNNPQ